MVRASGLDLARLVVVPVDGPQIAVPQQIAGDANPRRISIGDLGGGDVAEEMEVDWLAEGYPGPFADLVVERRVGERAALGGGP